MNSAMQTIKDLSPPPLWAEDTEGNSSEQASGHQSHMRWSGSQTRLLLQECKTVPITKRTSISVVGVYLSCQPLWTMYMRSASSIRHRLDLIGVKTPFCDNDIDAFLTSSPYLKNTLSSVVQPKPAVYSGLTSTVKFDYKNAERVFKLLRLADCPKQHICTMWREVPDTVVDIESRIEQFCAITAYSKDTLYEMMTEEAITYQQQLQSP